jgi:hypothetical protein
LALVLEPVQALVQVFVKKDVAAAVERLVIKDAQQDVAGAVVVNTLSSR